MEIHGNIDGGDGIFAVEDAVGVADVEEFDGEDVRGPREFFFGEEEWSGFALIGDPPLDGRSYATEVWGGQGSQDHQDIQVGMLFVEIAAGSRAVKDYGVQILGGQLFEAVD